MSEQVGPHKFSPLSWHDRLWDGGRCSACYFPKGAHPIMASWSIARPLGDTRRCTYSQAIQMELAAVGGHTPGGGA